MKRALMIAVMIVMVLGFSMQTQAALELRGMDINGNRLIYDTDFDITWYDYSNSTTTWQAQMGWASSLSVLGGDLVGVYDNWRLPTALNQDGSDPCTKYNCTESEMGHLYYMEFGNIAYPSSGYGLSNTGDFQNLQSGDYFLGTEYSTYGALYFGTDRGLQGRGAKGADYYAIAVRTGDVSVVPEPISSILFLTGGATLGFRRFRKKLNLRGIK